MSAWYLHSIHILFGPYSSHSQVHDLGLLYHLFSEQFSSFNCLFKSCTVLTAKTLCHMLVSEFVSSWNFGSILQMPLKCELKVCCHPPLLQRTGSNILLPLSCFCELTVCSRIYQSVLTPITSAPFYTFRIQLHSSHFQNKNWNLQLNTSPMQI
jgi:hypothetical protein